MDTAPLPEPLDDAGFQSIVYSPAATASGSRRNIQLLFSRLKQFEIKKAAPRGCSSTRSTTTTTTTDPSTQPDLEQKVAALSENEVGGREHNDPDYCYFTAFDGAVAPWKYSSNFCVPHADRALFFDVLAALRAIDCSFYINETVKAAQWKTEETTARRLAIDTDGIVSYIVRGAGETTAQEEHMDDGLDADITRASVSNEPEAKFSSQCPELASKLSRALCVFFVAVVTDVLRHLCPETERETREFVLLYREPTKTKRPNPDDQLHPDHDALRLKIGCHIVFPSFFMNREEVQAIYTLFLCYSVSRLHFNTTDRAFYLDREMHWRLDTPLDGFWDASQFYQGNLRPAYSRKIKVERTMTLSEYYTSTRDSLCSCRQDDVPCYHLTYMKGNSSGGGVGGGGGSRPAKRRRTSAATAADVTGRPVAMAAPAEDNGGGGRMVRIVYAPTSYYEPQYRFEWNTETRSYRRVSYRQLAGEGALRDMYLSLSPQVFVHESTFARALREGRMRGASMSALFRDAGMLFRRTLRHDNPECVGHMLPTRISEPTECKRLVQLVFESERDSSVFSGTLINLILTTLAIQKPVLYNALKDNIDRAFKGVLFNPTGRPGPSNEGDDGDRKDDGYRGGGADGGGGGGGEQPGMPGPEGPVPDGGFGGDRSNRGGRGRGRGGGRGGRRQRKQTTRTSKGLDQRPPYVLFFSFTCDMYCINRCGYHNNTNVTLVVDMGALNSRTMYTKCGCKCTKTDWTPRSGKPCKFFRSYLPGIDFSCVLKKRDDIRKILDYLVDQTTADRRQRLRDVLEEEDTRRPAAASDNDSGVEDGVSGDDLMDV